MRAQPSWSFPSNMGGLASGFNDSSMDTFKGRRLDSLIREIIQNSLDARADQNKPVVVDFQFKRVRVEGLTELSTLKEHIVEARKTAQAQKIDQAASFYEMALDRLKLKEIPFIAVHDSNTSGLTGPIKGPNGAWYALTKGAGITQKNSTGGLGSFGHGSKAPFVSSEFRTIFYLSVVNEQGVKQTRFQGKSILQSYELQDGGMTQGTGFYGNPEGCAPLINEAVPEWALSLRRHRVQDSTGTSILIPASIWGEDSFESMSITAIANFFYAIYKGALEVQIGHLERLTAENIVQKFYSYQSKQEGGFQEVDKDNILEAFNTIQTIVSPTEQGEQQIPQFGRIDWFMRMGADIEARTVAVARGNGMLITKKAPKLQRFPNLKPFDFFVCVSGEGSEILKSAENPEHTNFEFDRVDNIEVRHTNIRKYESMVKSIRDILSRFAEYSSKDQVIIDDLKDLFADISSNADSTSGGTERGVSIQIANGNFAFKKKNIDQERQTPDGEGGAGETGGRGDRAGDKTKQSEGGVIPDDEGATKIVGPSVTSNDPTQSKKVVKLRNIRMRPSTLNKSDTIIFFDADISGPVSITLCKSGEVGTEPLPIKLDKVVTKRFDVQLEKNKRNKIIVKFIDEKIDFALEGEAHEV
jgi:hypothetical protein